MNPIRSLISCIALFVIVVIGAVAAVLWSLGLLIIDGSGKMITQSELTPTYQSVVFEGQGSIEFVHDTKYKIEITAEDNLISYAQREVTNGTLNIRYPYSRFIPIVRPKEKAIIKVYAPSFSDVTLRGDIKASGNVSSKTPFKLVTLGNVSLEGSINADQATFDTSGNTILSLSGQVAKGVFDLKGNVSVFSPGLVCKDVNVTLRGHGDTTLSVKDTLDASIQGVGSIWYYGNPTVKKNILGQGTVDKKGDAYLP